MAKDLTEALRLMMEGGAGQSSREDNSLPAGRPVSNIPARSGTGSVKSKATGGGIASPLTETQYADRTWHPETTLTSSDGIFTMKIRAIKSIKMLDADNAEVVMNFKAAT